MRIYPEAAIRAGRHPAGDRRRISPASGLYFYNPTGATSEWLFRALMQQLRFTPDSKESGLREFKRRGWVLVDATYEPVNELPNGSKRDKAIVGDYQSLRDDLASLLPDRSTPLVLIKENVGRGTRRGQHYACRRCQSRGRTRSDRAAVRGDGSSRSGHEVQSAGSWRRD
jgi:hypothetical protein